MNILPGAALLLLLFHPAPAQPHKKALWINVPFVAQPRDGCGAASVAMVMRYWAAQEHLALTNAEDVSAIQKQVYSRRLHGATPAALEGYLQRNGYRTFAVDGSWHELNEQIRKGRPVIVALRPPGQRALHYVVIDGIDPGRGLIMMNDPELRKLLPESRKQFEKDWSATHRWMLLAVPRQSHHRS